MSQYMNKRDVNAFRRQFFMDVDLTDDQLMNGLNHYPDIIALAREWGWNDTEVRDKVADILRIEEDKQYGEGSLKHTMRELFGDDESDYIVDAVKGWLVTLERDTRSDNWMSRGPGLKHAIRNLR